MNTKTKIWIALWIALAFAGLWIGSWVAHEFAGTWMLQPIVVTSIIAFSVGTIIFVAAVIAVVFGDDNG